MANGNFDYRSFLTGIDPAGGGKTELGANIPGMIPGGGALAGLGQVAGGIADIVGSKNEIDRQRRKRQGAKGRRQEARGALDSFEFDVSQAQRDLATAGIRPTDLSPMQGVQATELAALSSDPRALMGGIGASTARANQAIQATQQADLSRELTAMGNLANLEQRALQQKQGLQLGLLQSDRELALQDQMQASQNIEAARARKRDAFGNIAGGLANIGIAAATGGLGGAASSAAQGLTGASGLAPELAKTLGPSLIENIVPTLQVPNQKKGGRIKYQEGGKMNEDVMMRILEEQRPVQKTEGEFNHDTNKKAIVDEETGVKEGEATGGEYILNPEQGEEINMAYKSVEQIMESGEEPTMEQLMSLYEAVQGVFSQPQFNEA